MAEDRSDYENSIYMQSAVIYEFLQGLFNAGRLNVDSLEEAVALGAEYFEQRDRRGMLPDNWRDIVYADLLQ
jgi:hypothetical protein